MRIALTHLLALGLCWAGAAQTNAQEPHSHQIEEMVVTAHPLSADGTAQPFDRIEGDELARKLTDNIGDTVAQEPGIHSATFGPAVGRPVIHGLSGARVRVTEDHMDTMDVSVSLGDHAVTVDPFIANEIQILKGPSTLVYGPGAIGGVVDVHTGRVPRRVPDALTGRFLLQGADNANAKRGALRVDGGGGSFAWHIDASASDGDDLDIPGYAESARLRALEEDEHDHEEEHHEDEDHEGEDHEEEGHEEEGHDEGHDEEEVKGTLPASFVESASGAFGLSYVGERSLIGVTVSRFETEYGLPGHSHDHGHGHEEDEHDGDDHEEDHEEGHEEDHEDEHGEEAEGPAFIDLEQTRINLEAALIDPLPGFHSARLRVGVNDYEHSEVEPSGEPGTVFKNNAWEARGELSHAAWVGWNGVLGVQASGRDYQALGEEALTPPVDTTAYGLYWVGQRNFEGFQLEAGLRFDQVEQDPEADRRRKFDGLSASLGAVVPLASGWTVTGLVDYATRAPIAEELYSNGPHLATESFEQGDPGLAEESAFNLSATLGYEDDRVSFLATAYHTNFADFIYLADTGQEMDGLPLRQYRQEDATYQGLDVQASVVLAAWSSGQLTLEAQFDAVAADIDASEDENPPRLPPDRAGVGLALTQGPLFASLNYKRAFKQTETAPYELPTDGYDDLRARLSWRLETDGALISLFLQGRNLTDAEQRLHTSFIKDVAPAPGRTIEGGIRVQF